MDELGETSAVYMADSIRHVTPQNEYEAFHVSEDPCSDKFAWALCRRKLIA